MMSHDFCIFPYHLSDNSHQTILFTLLPHPTPHDRKVISIV